MQPLPIEKISPYSNTSLRRTAGVEGPRDLPGRILGLRWLDLSHRRYLWAQTDGAHCRPKIAVGRLQTPAGPHRHRWSGVSASAVVQPADVAQGRGLDV